MRSGILFCIFALVPFKCAQDKEKLRSVRKIPPNGKQPLMCNVINAVVDENLLIKSLDHIALKTCSPSLQIGSTH